jgi:hypothetical protein
MFLITSLSCSGMNPTSCFPAKSTPRSNPV